MALIWSVCRRCASPACIFVIFTLRPRRTGPPARDLVRDQQDQHASAATSSSTSHQRRSIWQLLALAVAGVPVGWLIARSRLGFALRVIGEDETVARHCRHQRRRSPRWRCSSSQRGVHDAGRRDHGAALAYIDAAIAFNPMISFQVVIMALLGGTHRLWGPVLGVVPLTLLFEFLSARFPHDSRDPARARLPGHRLLPAARRRPGVRRIAAARPVIDAGIAANVAAARRGRSRPARGRRLRAR